MKFTAMRWKLPTVSARPDFFKCVHISIFFITQICTESVSRSLCRFALLTRKFKHTCCTDLRFKKLKILDTLRKITDSNCQGLMSRANENSHIFRPPQPIISMSSPTGRFFPFCSSGMFYTNLCNKQGQT